MIRIHSLKVPSNLRNFTGCLLLLLASPAGLAINFTVNDAADSVDINPGDGICETVANGGNCTLRAAVQESNAWPGIDSIQIPAGTYTLSTEGAGEDAAATGDLDITEALTLRGAGDDLSIIDANLTDRAIDIHRVNVTIEHLTIQDGRPDPGAVGGGIRSIEGALIVRNSTLTNNTTIGSFANFGGGAINSFGGPLTIDYTTITNNRSTQGAGVRHFGPYDLTISNSRINDNDANNGAGLGGGLYIDSDANNSITNTTIDGNTAPLGGGGGIYTVYGLTIVNSTISNNVANFLGGGGITGPFVDLGERQLIITNSTISGNSVLTGNGGGIWLNQSNAVITNSTIIDNSASGGEVTSGYAGGLFLRSGRSVVLKNTIIADNIAGKGGADNCHSQDQSGNNSTVLTNSENSISSDSSCELTDTSDQPDTDPNLDTLDFNGGPTQTHAIISPGQAIDLGANTFADSTLCPATDQRGFPRPVDGGTGNLNCDIGATEYDPSPSIADLGVTVEESMDPAIVGSNLVYNITITNNGPGIASGIVLTDLLDSGVSYVSDTASCTAGATLSCTLSSISRGDSATVTVTVTPNTVGLISNTASVSANESDPNSSNNSATETTLVSGISDLSATLSGSIDPATANVAMNYTVTITNNGADTANTTTPIIQFDDNISIGTVTTGIGSCSKTTGRVTCDFGEMANGASADITIQVIPLRFGTVTSTAYANFSGTDLSMANNISALTTTVDADATLSITASDAPDPAFQGADIFYSFTVANSGPSTTNETELVVTLPADMSLSPEPGASSPGCAGAGIITCDLGSLANGQTKTVTLVARASAIGTFTVDASATSNETSGAAVASEVTEVSLAIVTPPVADLLITMTDAADPAVVGSNVTYTITATNNNGPNVAQDVFIDFTLPISTTFSSASSGCTFNGSTVTCNIGALAIGSSATVNISVTTSSVGTINASALVGDRPGNDPVLSNNSVSQETQINNAIGSGSTASRINSGGGGYSAMSELGLLLFFIVALSLQRRKRMTS